MMLSNYLLSLFLLMVSAESTGRVYVVPGSDSSVSGGLNVSQYYNSFNTSDPVFCSPSGNLAQTMDSTYRMNHLDSLGNPVKFTWWANGGSMYSKSLNSGPWISLELIINNQYDAITTWGDELAYHYHTWVWYDYDGDGTSYWNQSITFEQSRYDFDLTLGQMILDFGIYPPSFRSGWNSMDTDWENRLDEIIPYRMENGGGGYSWDTIEPLSGLIDWLNAPTQWYPYHPSTTDYKSFGTQKGWETRHIYMNSLNLSRISSIFSAATTGQDQIICAWSHVAESDFPSQFTSMHARLWSVKSTFPSVDFEYCTALDAYKKFLKYTDAISPDIKIYMDKSGDNRSIYFTSSESLYQSIPMTPIKTKSGEYSIITALQLDTTIWKFSYHQNSTMIEQLAIGGCDTSGNTTVSIGTIENHYIDFTPSISLIPTEQSIDSANKFYVIQFNASDYDDNALISLYYDSNSAGFDGNTIITGILEDSSNQIFWWDTSSIPEGLYYIYGLIQDDVNIPVVDYSQYPLFINHSNGDSISPNPVINLSAYDSVTDQVILKWTKPTMAFDGDYPLYYLIYRSLDNSVSTTLSNLMAITNGNSTSFIDHTLTSGSTYYYCLYGVDENSNISLSSNTVSASPTVLDHIPPNKIIDLSTDTTQYLSIQLNWSIPPAASDGDIPDKFIIHRDTKSNVDFTNPLFVLDTISGYLTNWMDTTVNVNSTYYYVLTSLDDSGNESLNSNEVSTKPNTIELIIDNLDPGFTVLQGAWSTNSTTPLHWGSDYRYISTNTSSISGLIEWRPNIPNQGTYRIYVWYNQGTNRATDALYIIHHSSNTTWIRVNQQINGGQWNNIGQYYLSSGSIDYVETANYCPESPGKVVMADAVRFVLESFQPVFLNDWSIYN